MAHPSGTSFTVSLGDARALRAGDVINDGHVDWLVLQVVGVTVTVRRLRWYGRLWRWLRRLPRYVIVNLHWWRR